MKRFLTPNIDRIGRWIRLAYAVLLLVLAIVIFKHHRVGAIVLFCFSAFALFEAARGWCLVRACGIKTKY